MRLLLAACLAILVGLMGALPAAEAAGTTTTVPIAEVRDNPCTPAPEAIALSGEVHLTTASTVSADGTTHVKIHLSAQLKGEDPVPQLRYIANEEQNAEAKFPAGTPFTYTSYIKLINEKSVVDNFYYQLNFHLSPNGTGKLHETRVTCRG